MQEGEKEKRPRIQGVPVESARAEPAPAAAAAPVRAQGIPVEPMGSRIPAAAAPAAMQRSFFDMPQTGGGHARRAPDRDGGIPQVRASIVARPAEPAAAARAMGQAAPSVRTAPVSLAEATDLAANLDDALDALRLRPPADPACPEASRLASVTRDRLRQFLVTAKPGETYPMTGEELAPLDKTFSCAYAAKRALESSPNTAAYVVLGIAVAAAVLAVNI